MRKDEFLVYEKASQNPTDLESAINTIKDAVTKMGSRELDLKLGEILGKMSAYRLTGDCAVLESIVVDIAIIMQSVGGGSMESRSNYKKIDIYQSTTEKPSDLIHFATANDGWVDRKVLLDEFFKYLVENQVVTSQAVARCYKSYINNYLEASGCLNNVDMVKICELKINLQSFVAGKIQGYDAEQKKIRNTRSAAKKMIEFLERLLSK